MNAASLRLLLDGALPLLEGTRDELRDLDAAIGDGDLGITVAEGARAVRAALVELPEHATVSEVLRQAGQSFAAANPSTMSALVAAALLASAKALRETESLGRAEALLLVETVTATIQQRGQAELGDKTVLDALQPSLLALRSAGPSTRAALAAMTAAAATAVSTTASLTSRRGRAAWVGERTAGHPDGGATAYVRLLEALEKALPETD